MGETIKQEQGQAWSDRRMSEMCARQAGDPTVFGRQQDAWRMAASHFIAAHNCQQSGNAADVERHRGIALKALADAGLRVEQAAVRQRVEPATGFPAPPTVAQTAEHLVAQCTRRVLWLRQAADDGTAQHAMALGGLYGAAELYQRAVRAFARREDTPGHTFIQAAEQTLAWYRLRAPWHGQPPAQQPPAS